MRLGITHILPPFSNNMSSDPPVHVLRLGHRRERDKRITSHLGLTARAFGADNFVLSGEEDPNVLETLESVSERFGGNFNAQYEKRPMGWLRNFVQNDAGDGSPGIAIHLTMYGLPWNETVPEIPTDRPIAIVVGGAKVPGEVFGVCQYNISIGNQPHSEVAALAVFLQTWKPNGTNASNFNGGLTVVPMESGKQILSSEEISE